MQFLLWSHGNIVYRKPLKIFKIRIPRSWKEMIVATVQALWEQKIIFNLHLYYILVLQATTLSRIWCVSILYHISALWYWPPHSNTQSVNWSTTVHTHTEGEVTLNQYLFAVEVTHTLFHVDSFSSFCVRLFIGSMFCNLAILYIYLTIYLVFSVYNCNFFLFPLFIQLSQNFWHFKKRL